MPEVSVVVPAFDRATTIGETIDAIVAQRPAPAEVLVIDDGSTDGTAEAAERGGGAVRVIRHPERRGACAARNTGIELAAHEVVAFCDADDRWRAGWLASQVAMLEHDASASLSGLVAHHGRRQRRSGPWGLGRDPMAALLRDRHGGFSTSCLAVWRDSLGSTIRFDESFATLQDLDFLLQLAASGTRVVANRGAWVDKVAGSAERVYSGRRIVEGRRALIDKWGPDMRRVNGAHDAQLRRLVEAAARHGDADDWADALERFAAPQDPRAPANVALRLALRAGRTRAATTARLLRRADHATLAMITQRGRDMTDALIHGPRPWSS